MTAAMTNTDWGEFREQRKRAVRTAWVLAAVVVMIFVAFILSGVRGS